MAKARTALFAHWTAEQTEAFLRSLAPKPPRGTPQTNDAIEALSTRITQQREMLAALERERDERDRLRKEHALRMQELNRHVASARATITRLVDTRKALYDRRRFERPDMDQSIQRRTSDKDKTNMHDSASSRMPPIGWDDGAAFGGVCEGVKFYTRGSKILCLFGNTPREFESLQQLKRALARVAEEQ